MDTKLLLDNISKYIDLTTEEEQRFLSMSHYKKVRKRQLLVEETEINKYINFVTSGILRIFLRDSKGFEHNLQFAPPGWWIADVKSFMRQNPGELNIEAIEDSEVCQISKVDLDQLYDVHPKFERFFRILAENSLAAYQQLYVNSMGFTARERYESFCKLYPSLVMQLPQKYIASFIGVTPEFFSKMMFQMQKKK